MQYVDYYKTLGVHRNATKEDLTRAFKKLARKYHPDLNKSPDAEGRFKEINEAHAVLKDPETRARYDTLGANWKHGAPFEPPPQWGNNVRSDFGGSPSGAGGDFSDFFAAFMGGRGGGFRQGRARPGGVSLEDLLGGLGGDFAPAGGRRRGQGLDVHSELVVELADIYNGRTRSIELSGPWGTKRFEVKIPRGIRSGEQLRLAGQGMNGHDLYLVIKLAQHPLFAVDHDDLVVKVPVLAWDAALGSKTKVPTLAGDVMMTLPGGLSSGQRLRLKGKGLPRRSGGSGDLYAEIELVVPKELSPEQNRLFSQLKQVSEGA